MSVDRVRWCQCTLGRSLPNECVPPATRTRARARVSVSCLRGSVQHLAVCHCPLVVRDAVRRVLRGGCACVRLTLCRHIARISFVRVEFVEQRLICLVISRY